MQLAWRAIELSEIAVYVVCKTWLEDEVVIIPYQVVREELDKWKSTSLLVYGHPFTYCGVGLPISTKLQVQVRIILRNTFPYTQKMG